MWILLLGLTSGIVASSWASSADEVKLRSCSYLGVFHIQGLDRYTLTFDNAKQLCEELGTTLASLEQVTAAYGKGFESCRNGWISDGNVTIPRHVANPQCAGNQTGVITLSNPDPKNDAYCYDQTEKSEINCTFEIIQNLEEDDELPKTEDSEIQDLNHTDFPTDLPSTDPITDVPVDVHIDNTFMAVTRLMNTTEKTDPTPTSSHDEHNVSGELLDQITQTPSTTTEPEELEDATDGIFSVMSTLESTGSGMGEASLTSSSDPTTEDPYKEDTYETPTASTTDEGPLKPDLSVRPGGRMGAGMDTSTDNKDSSGSNKDWLVILLVVVAIAAIILIAALVVTRNRWCGRSQTLMITSKGSKEGNGTAASAASPQDQEREQEMVTLMNKEKIQENGNTEEFTVITLEESQEKNEQA